jgi:hypothetical protein
MCRDRLFGQAAVVEVNRVILLFIFLFIFLFVFLFFLLLLVRIHPHFFIAFLFLEHHVLVLFNHPTLLFRVVLSPPVHRMDHRGWR